MTSVKEEVRSIFNDFNDIYEPVIRTKPFLGFDAQDEDEAYSLRRISQLIRKTERY